MLLDIQEIIAKGKGDGYERWAKVYNIKQVALFFISGKAPQDSVLFFGTQPFRLSECSKGIGAFLNWQKMHGVRTHALPANL